MSPSDPPAEYRMNDIEVSDTAVDQVLREREDERDLEAHRLLALRRARRGSRAVNGGDGGLS